MIKKQVTIKTKFAGAKRLTQYEGKCQNLHGYEHIIEASFTAEEANGIVLDFYAAHAALNKWLYENWDHTVLLNKSDEKLGQFIAEYTGQKIYYFDFEPTAENLAEYLLIKILPQILPNAKALSVKLYDNENSYVKASL
jgi:6-pyruvoyl-tetrahydropterin synthase